MLVGLGVAPSPSHSRPLAFYLALANISVLSVCTMIKFHSKIEDTVKSRAVDRSTIQF